MTMNAATIGEADIRLVVERFYNEVRADQTLSAAFGAITDWDDHLERMTQFWSSLMLMTGRYKGNPVAMHLIHAERIRPEMFEHWLALWKKATSDVLPSETAAEVQLKATRIASRLSSALFGAEGANLLIARAAPASQPYRSTPVFSQETIPKPLLQFHTLRPGTWAKLSVLEGSLKYHLHSRPAIDVAAHGSLIIPPEVAHHLEIVQPVKCQLHFYDHQPNLD
jgi:hemoglobin